MSYEFNRNSRGKTLGCKYHAKKTGSDGFCGLCRDQMKDIFAEEDQLKKDNPGVGGCDQHGFELQYGCDGCKTMKKLLDSKKK